MANSRILFVDDDEMVLKGILRQQGDDFDISTANGPQEALKVLDNEDTFAVVVSDMRMPEMNGAQLLKRVRQKSPDTVRMILTGYAELNTTIEAVNEGHIFRFLAKPCDEDVMAASLQAGLRQYQLVEAERELVEGTLRGSVKVLADVLSLVNPLAFGQSTRVHATVNGILKRISVPDEWQLEIAAMLSSMGCLTLPQQLLEKKLAGEPFDFSEQSRFDEHSALASELIRNIPRLEEVSEIIANQTGNNNGSITEAIRLKSNILQLALEFDYHELQCESSLHALNELENSTSPFDKELLDALVDYVRQEKSVEIREVEIEDVREGMVIADDLFDTNRKLLMAKGQEITPSAIRLLSNYANNNLIATQLKIVG